MITGAVTPFREAVIRLRVRGPSGQEVEAEVVIDTGFTDFLTLPPLLIRTLALQIGGSMRVTLADGSEVDLNAYVAEVIWDGRVRIVTVLEANGSPLAGMSLLYGHELRVQVVDGGSVAISRLP